MECAMHRRPHPHPDGVGVSFTSPIQEPHGTKECPMSPGEEINTCETPSFRLRRWSTHSSARSCRRRRHMLVIPSAMAGGISHSMCLRDYESFALCALYAITMTLCVGQGKV